MIWAIAFLFKQIMKIENCEFGIRLHSGRYLILKARAVTLSIARIEILDTWEFDNDVYLYI